MQAGKLRELLKIEIPNETGTVTDYGEPIRSGWTTAGQFWGAVEPISGQERIEGGVVEAEVTHRVRMRWTKDHPILNQGRIRFTDSAGTGRIFEVIAIVNRGERDRELVCQCKERISDNG